MKDVPSGGFQAQAERVASWSISGDVGGHVFQDDEVFRGVLGSDSALVVAEHVHDPIQAVIDGPVIANHRSPPLDAPFRRVR